MKDKYFDLIDQSYFFPQEGFNLENGFLEFHEISLQHLIKKYGTPLKVTYLPKIGSQIKRAKNLFSKSIKTNGYRGKYHYCYCTKTNHFSFVIKEALRHQVNLETSSGYDIDIIQNLKKNGELPEDTIFIHNGYKTESYLEKIRQLRESGKDNSIVVLDSKSELEALQKTNPGHLNLGIRMAVDQEPQSSYYTSRMGIRPAEMLDFFRSQIKDQEHLHLKMFHFFIDSGIKDSVYYWGVFRKALTLYAEIKKECPELNSINLGGGLPIRNNLGFDYDYKYIINEIVRNIKEMCVSEGIEEPDIFTEFGKYTVGESGATVFKVLEVKQQNERELWYIIDNSLMTTLPDSWSIFEKFILLPVNKWEKPYTQVNIGGISCDQSDFYNTEALNQQLYLPKISADEKVPLYLGFFHTGAYQDSIGGYGGIKHCLIPSPRHVIIDRKPNGQFVDRLFRDEQQAREMLDILGYGK